MVSVSCASLWQDFRIVTERRLGLTSYFDVPIRVQFAKTGWHVACSIQDSFTQSLGG